MGRARAGQGVQSAGLLMCKRTAAGLQVLLVHPGGPFWARKDRGAWTIPKGLVHDGEPLLQAAQREFLEETGLQPPSVGFVSLGSVTQKAGKLVHAWALAGDCNPAELRSNQFQIEWPPRSGLRQSFPEVDRAEFFDLPTAALKILPAQQPFLDRLQAPDVLQQLFGSEGLPSAE